MTKKLITIVSSLSGGGAEKIAADLSFGFNAHLDQTTITVDADDIPSYKVAGKIIQLGVEVTAGIHHKLKRQLRIVSALRKQKKEVIPDVSISHAAMANVQNLFSGTGEKKIFVLHGEFDYKSVTGNKLINRFFGKLYATADAIVSVSQFIKNDFERLHGSTIPHRVIYNGINLKKIEELAAEPVSINVPDKYYVYLAQLRPEKNHLRFLTSVADSLRGSDIKILLIGEGSQRSIIEKAILEHGIQNNIILTGRMENPFPVLKNAQASIIASETESFSLAAVESLAVGVPVITADCGGPREILGVSQDQEVTYPYYAGCGILVPSYLSWNKATFADELVMLWKDGVMRAKLAEAAKERARFFSIEKATEEYISLISAIV